MPEQFAHPTFLIGSHLEPSFPLRASLTLVALAAAAASPILAAWVRPRIRHCHGRLFIIVAIAVFLSYTLHNHLS